MVREVSAVKRPTIADIAQRAGVTKAAVSFALNNQPGVSPSTRQRGGSRVGREGQAHPDRGHDREDHAEQTGFERPGSQHGTS